MYSGLLVIAVYYLTISYAYFLCNYIFTTSLFPPLTLPTLYIYAISRSVCRLRRVVNNQYNFAVTSPMVTVGLDIVNVTP